MNLSSSYAGLDLAGPVMIGSCPLALDFDHVDRSVAAGASAIVMPSIFEEQILRDEFSIRRLRRMHPGIGETLPITGPDLESYNGGTENYLRTIERHKKTHSIPIIASVNCVEGDAWADYGKRLESAGADAIEINLFHYEVDPTRFAEEVEHELIQRVAYAVSATNLDVAVKLLPQFTCLANFAFRIAGAGAKSVCLFGQAPVFEPRHQQKVHHHWRLTNHADLRVSLDAVHQVRTAVHNLTIGASGGMHDADDAIAAIQLGADVVMLTSAVYKQGPEVIQKVRDALTEELQRQEMTELKQLVGSQFSGYDAFPQRTRREQYAASVADLSSRQQEK